MVCAAGITKCLFGSQKYNVQSMTMLECNLSRLHLISDMEVDVHKLG